MPPSRHAGRHDRHQAPCSTPTTPPARTLHVNFTTSKDSRAGRPIRAGATSTGWCCDSDWEAEFCRVAEAHPRVRAYVKNHSLGFEVPYRLGSDARATTGRTSSCVIDDGHGEDDLLQPRGGDQGLPRRGRQGQEDDDGHVLGARREQAGHLRSLGLRRVHRARHTTSKLTSRNSSRAFSRPPPSDGTPPWPTKKSGTTFVGVDTLKHSDDKRKNIPTAEYQSLMADEARKPVQVSYPRGTSNDDGLKAEKQQRNRDIDPQLVWRGKDDQDWTRPGGECTTAVHPGEGAPQGAD